MSAAMNEIIKISSQMIGFVEVNSVNARDIHNYVESKKDFSNWIKNRLEQLNAVENEDFVKLTQKGELSKTGQTRIEYIVTLDIAKHLAMMERNAQGKNIRDYFIACEKALHVKREREVLKPVLDYEGGKVAHILHGFKHDINPTAFLNVALISKFERMFGEKSVRDFYANLIGVSVEEVKAIGINGGVSSFAYKCTIPSLDAFTSNDALYAHYLLWCGADEALGREIFLRQFSKVTRAKQTQIRIGGARPRGYMLHLNAM